MDSTRTDPRHVALGLVLVSIGMTIALDRLGILEWERLLAIWPLVVVFAGGHLIVRALSGPRTSRSGALAGDIQAQGLNTGGDRS